MTFDPYKATPGWRRRETLSGSYSGCLRVDGRVVWTCAHDHAWTRTGLFAESLTDSAVSCARAELERLKAAAK